MFFLYTAVTCALKPNISKCDQFLKWQKPIKLFKNVEGVRGARAVSLVAVDLEPRFLWLVGKPLGSRWGWWAVSARK